MLSTTDLAVIRTDHRLTIDSPADLGPNTFRGGRPSAQQLARQRGRTRDRRAPPPRPRARPAHLLKTGRSGSRMATLFTGKRLPALPVRPLQSQVSLASRN